MIFVEKWPFRYLLVTSRRNFLRESCPARRRILLTAYRCPSKRFSTSNTRPKPPLPIRLINLNSFSNVDVKTGGVGVVDVVVDGVDRSVMDPVSAELEFDGGKRVSIDELRPLYALKEFVISIYNSALTLDFSNTR